MQRRGKGAALIKEGNLQALEQRDETTQVYRLRDVKESNLKMLLQSRHFVLSLTTWREKGSSLARTSSKFHCSGDPDGTILPPRITRRSSCYFMPFSFKISLMKHSVSITRRCKERAVLPNGWIWWGWGKHTHTHTHFIFPEEQCEISNPQL